MAGAENRGRSLDDATIYAELTGIFREQLEKPDLVIAPGMTQDDVPGWDSTGMVAIVMTVEEQFGIEFGPKELKEIHRVGDLAALIKKHKG